MIAVIIPVHNEERTLARCLQAVQAAANYPLLEARNVQTIVVLDCCTDGSEKIALEFDISIIHADFSNVGAARAAGAAYAISCGATWLASTDADTVVASDWLWQQRRLEAEVVCGTVGVEDWDDHGHAAVNLRDYFTSTYTDMDGHSHVHGANFGVSTLAYQKAGGFKPLACSEDVALVEALINAGAVIAWTAAPRVVTSARVNARVRGGFGDTLKALAVQQQDSDPDINDSLADSSQCAL